MRKKIIIFVLFIIIGVVLLHKNLFLSKEIVASYNLNSISEVKGYEINEDNSIKPKEQESLLIIRPEVDTFIYGNLNFSSPISDELTLTAILHTNKNENLVINKNMRKGITEFSFDLPNERYDQIDINISNKNKTSFTLESINFSVQTTDIFQKNAIWFTKIFILITICGCLTIIVDKLINKKKSIEKKVSLNYRNSNIELLRIICMIAIICHHLVVHGGAINMELSSNRLFTAFLLPLGKIAFTCFMAISTWFLVDSKFKTSRFLKVWSQVFFYSFIFTIVSLLITKELSFVKVLASMLPITGTSHGYASSYLLLYLMIPFLNKATKNLNKFQARFFLCILLYAQVISQIIGDISGFHQPIFSEFLLFIMIYMLSFNIKRYPIAIIKDKVLCLLVFLGIWLVLVQITIFNFNGMHDTYLNWINFITKDESSITYIIAGYALFFFFNNLKIKKRKSINIVAGTTFGVLLLHDHFYLRSILWNDIIKCSQWYYISYFPFIVLGIAIVIFIIFACFDYVRKEFIEIPAFENRKINELIDRMDAKLNEDN